jgi:hypothetical protein
MLTYIEAETSGLFITITSSLHHIMKNYTIGKVITSAAIAASLLASGAGMALAQNVTGSSTTDTGVTTMTATGTATSGPSVPGVPNTGAGGDTTGTWLLLGVTGLIAAGGAWYLIGRRTPATQK